MAIFRDYTSNPVDHDRSIEDRRRHRQLVEKSIKENLGDILSEESIVGESKNKKFKIPIKGIKEYQFVYGRNSKGVATGVGDEQRGDKIGNGKKQIAQGNQGAGNQEGDDVYETEITLEELMDYISEDLNLPNLDQIYKRKKGICFDYAAVMTAMLRSQGVPTKLVIGYTGNAYHAWVNVYSKKRGWITGAIYFNGKKWKLMDPTFASTSKSSKSIMKYIGNGRNYK